MKRRDFLKGLVASSAAIAPLGTPANPFKPGDKLPEAVELGEIRCFVEDVYWNAPEGSHTQNRGLPAHASLFKGVRSRIVYKCWDGKNWVPHA